MTSNNVFPEFLERALSFDTIKTQFPEFLERARHDPEHRLQNFWNVRSISVKSEKNWSRISGPPQNFCMTSNNVFPEFLERALSFDTIKTQFPEFLQRARSFVMIQNTVSRISGTSTAFR
jgi:hypothetical protein